MPDTAALLLIEKSLQRIFISAVGKQQQKQFIKTDKETQKNGKQNDSLK